MTGPGATGPCWNTSDGYTAYATAIEEVYGEWVTPERKPGPGRPPGPRREMPAGLVYAKLTKKREKGHVVEVIRAVVFGMACLLAVWLRRSKVSNKINTSFVGPAQRHGPASERAQASEDVLLLAGQEDARRGDVLRVVLVQLLPGGADAEGKGRRGLASEDAGDGGGAGGPRLVTPRVAHLPR